MVHSSISKAQAVASVLTTGYAGNLAKGQLAFVKDKGVKGSGLEVITSFAAMSKKDKFAIRIGEVTTPQGLRVKEVNSKSTGFFPLEAVIDISAHVPSQTKLKVDHIEVGYDGINANTALFIPEGKSATVDLMVHGHVASFFFGQSEYVITKEVYRPTGTTMQEVIQNLVKELQEERVPSATGWASVTDQLSQFLEIGITDSTATVTGTPAFFATVTIPDAGESNDLAAVQAQYPALKVMATDRKEGNTTYTVVTTEPVIALAPVEITKTSIVYEDCDNCPAGYTAAPLEGYCIKEEVGTYAWNELKECKISTKNYSIILADTECGTSRLVELQDAYPELTITESAGEGAVVGGCKRGYNTSVVTNIVCEECNDIYFQPFAAEAPIPFEGISWTAQAVVYDADALMGIYVKGKPFYMYPEAHEEDYVPYIETSLKVKSMTFGAKGSLLLNFDGDIYDPNTEFAPSRRIQYSQDVSNDAEALFGAERMGNLHYTNKDIHKKNLFARTNLSQERILKYHKKYVQYAVKLRDNSLSQGGAGRSEITHELRLIVEYGNHTALQTVLNTLATKLGLDTVTIP